MDDHARLTRLRGTLPAEGLGARGLERVARNPSCQRLLALTIVGVSPTTAAAKIYGESTRDGQSPFALNAGNGFEGALFENNAARLVELYQAKQLLGPAEQRVAVVPDRIKGFNRAAMAQRLALRAC
jgi:hypothetical protein